MQTRRMVVPAVWMCLFLATVCVERAAGQGVAAPPGSYLRTCYSVSYDRVLQVLYATCFAKPGDYQMNTSGVPTQLNTSYCDPGSDIEQLNGWLQCTARAGTWGDGGAVPRGSYQKSCDHYIVQQVTRNGARYPRLGARCSSYNSTGSSLGLPRTTQAEYLLDLSQCSMNGDIAYYDGDGGLTCAALPPPSRSPQGQTQQPSQQQQQRQTPAVPTPRGSSSGSCKPGYVWRMVDPDDHVCVTAQTRQQIADENTAASQYTVVRAVHAATAPSCVPGYVWRQADKTDFVCVTPQARAAAQADNAAAASRTN